MEKQSLCNILCLKGPWFKTRRTPGFFCAVAKINVRPQILEKCPKVTQPRLLEMKKAVATFSLSEKGNLAQFNWSYDKC